MRVFILLPFLLLLATNAFAKSQVAGFERQPNNFKENKGTSQTNLQKANNWIRIEGDSAKVLYQAMEVQAKNNQGEAGLDIFFKSGKSYTCWHDTANLESHAFVCTILIIDPSKGLVK